MRPTCAGPCAWRKEVAAGSAPIPWQVRWSCLPARSLERAPISRWEDRTRRSMRSTRPGHRARGATLYSTLEPCSFHGRTPPCSHALIRAGIERLVCAMQDPDPRVNGAGLRQLRDAGIAVEVGLLETQARRQNAAYVKHRTSGMPQVILKLAQTLDGQIAAWGGEARWITGAKARAHAHRWRSWGRRRHGRRRHCGRRRSTAECPPPKRQGPPDPWSSMAA